VYGFLPWVMSIVLLGTDIVLRFLVHLYPSSLFWKKHGTKALLMLVLFLTMIVLLFVVLNKLEEMQLIVS